jgi:peptide/nickel transport system permease protein
MASSDSSRERTHFAAAVSVVVVRTVGMLWLLHLIIFAIFDLLPDAAYSRLGSAALERRTLEMTRKQLGLDGSAFERYARSLSNTVRGDLGRSLQSGYPVASLLRERATVSLPIIALTVAICVTVMLWAARWFCVPTLSGVQRALLAIAPAAVMPQFASASAFAVGGALIFGAAQLSSGTEHLISYAFLIVSVAIMPAALILIGAARSAQDTVRRRFVLTYLATGFSWADISRLVQPNILRAMLPLCNRACIATLTGTIFAELSFNRPGIGAVLAEAIRTGDQPVACGWMLAVAAPVILLSQIAASLAKRFPPA